jgi:hypothetical protein
MPESRNRAKHHHHTTHRTSQPIHHAPAKVKRSAALVVATLAAILGLAVAFFTQGPDLFWMIIGTVGGGIIGYLVGRGMDKSIEKAGRK